MDDTQTSDGAAPFGLQGPHWHDAPGPAADALPPLRLVLQPQGFPFQVTQSEVLIGRHSLADIRLPLPDVSRRHCRLVCAQGRWEVFDLDSLNGVFINGERVQHARLYQNDLLQVGGLVLVVDFPGAEASQATANFRPFANHPLRKAG